VDATASEVFREQILYLMYLMNNQKTDHNRTLAELHQQLLMEIDMKEKFQRELFTCREVFKHLKEQLGALEPASTARRELSRIIAPMEQLW